MNFLLNLISKIVFPNSIAPEMQRELVAAVECSRNTKQLTGLSFTRFDTVTATKSLY
jgi:hypothetical protein